MKTEQTNTEKYFYIDNLKQETFIFNSLKKLKEYHKIHYNKTKLKKGVNNSYYN